MTTAQQLRRPRLLDSVVVVTLPSRLVFRDGSRGEVVLELEDDRAASVLLRLMDGARSWDEIFSEAARRWTDVPADELAKAADRMSAAGVLEDEPDSAPLTPQQLARYSRNLVCFGAQFPLVGTKYEVQQRLADARVLILGVGGLGAGCALGLAMVGIGSLVLVDFDVVELQNLNRQVLYDVGMLGESKVEAAARRLRAVNPEPAYVCRTNRIGSVAQIDSLLQQDRPDLVILGADRPWLTIDRHTSKACETVGIPYVTGTVNGGFGAVWSRVPGKTSCEECRLKWLAQSSTRDYEVVQARERGDLMSGTSALGFGVQIISGLMGFEALHYLLGTPMASAGHCLTVSFDNLSLTDEAQPVHPQCNCRLAAAGGS
jgi:molybdopterin-synthase adenylyltransferase